MAYNPNMYMPYQPSYTQPYMQPNAQGINGLVRIEGIEGAQMYQMPPNSVSPPLFLSSENAFFIKTTDGGGAATLKKYTFAEETMTDTNASDYVTKSDFEAFANEIREAVNGQRAVPEQPAEESAG